MSQVAHLFKDKQRTVDVTILEDVDFSGLLLSDPVTKGLKNSGFERPSPIQLKAIPLGRCGLDLIVQAKSGTGKTCVFTVIALESLQLDSYTIQVLVLAPTREIAIQIWDVIKRIGSVLPALQCHTFIGGLPVQEDKAKLKKCHIAVGTPGRIKQLIEFGDLSTASIRLFVLDEADKLLEESFQQQINWIYSMLPENKQMMALSATYPEYLAQHLTAYMRNPTFIRLNITDPALLGIRQFYASVPYHPMPQVVFESKTKILLHIFSSISFQQCLVFSNLQTRAQSLAESLKAKDWPTACIAGSLEQKERNEAMARLKTYKCRILISTDLTSRGIDADKVDLVINMDVPKDHETYLHRIGRAGRFGSYGASITIVSEGQEMLDLQSVEKKCNTHINELPDPLPTDLLKTEVKVCLDDVVSADVIQTVGNKDDGAKPSDEVTAQYCGTFVTNHLNRKSDGNLKESLKNQSSTRKEKIIVPDKNKQSGQYHLQGVFIGNMDTLEKKVHNEECEFRGLVDNAVTVQNEFTPGLNMVNGSESFHRSISSLVNFDKVLVPTEPSKLIKHSSKVQSDSCVISDSDRSSSHMSHDKEVTSETGINLDGMREKPSVKGCESVPFTTSEMIVESSTLPDNFKSHALNISNALTANSKSIATDSAIINNRNRGTKDIQDSLVLYNNSETSVKRTKPLKNKTKSCMALRKKNVSSDGINDSSAGKGKETAGNNIKKHDEQASVMPNKKSSTENIFVPFPDIPKGWSMPEFSTSIGYKRLTKIATYNSDKEDLEKFLQDENGNNDDNIESMINKKLRIPREVPIKEEDRQIIRTIITSFNNLKCDHDGQDWVFSNLDLMESATSHFSKNLVSKAESTECSLNEKDSESKHAPVTTNTEKNFVSETVSASMKEEMPTAVTHFDEGNLTKCISRNVANKSNPNFTVGGVHTSDWKYPFLKTGAIPKKHLQKLAVGNLALWGGEEDTGGETSMTSNDESLMRTICSSQIMDVNGVTQYTEDSDSDSLSESETNSREFTETSTKESETSSHDETNSSKTKQSIKSKDVGKVVNQNSTKINLHAQELFDQVRSERFIQNRRCKLNRLDTEVQEVEIRNESFSHSNDCKSAIRNQNNHLPQNNCIPSHMPVDGNTQKMPNDPYNWYQPPYYQYRCGYPMWQHQYRCGYPMWQHQIPFLHNQWQLSSYVHQPYSQTWYHNTNFNQGQRSQSSKQDDNKRMEEIYKAQWNYIKMMSKR